MGTHINDLKNKSALPQFNFYANNYKQSTKAEVAQAGVSVVGLVLAGLLTKGLAKSQGTQSTQTAEQVQQNAYIAMLSTSEGIAKELANVNNSIEDMGKIKAELTKLLEGDTQKEIETNKKQIDEINKKSYTNNSTQTNISAEEISAAIAKRETAESNQKSLKTQFNIDKATIDNLTTSATAVIGNLTVAGQQITEPTVNDGVLNGDTYSKQYTDIMSKLTQTTAPDKNDDDFAKKSKEFNKYVSANNQKATIDAKQAQLDKKINAQQKLKQFKITYGASLDGMGGTYKTQMEQYQKDIDEVNQLEQQVPSGFADARTKSTLTSKNAKLETLVNSYTTTTTTYKKGKDGKVTNNVEKTEKTLDEATIKAKISKLDEAIAKAQAFKENLQNIQSNNSTLNSLETLSEDQNKKDGNWFTRMFSKGKRDIRKNRKDTKTNIADTKKQQAQAIAAYLEKLKSEAKALS